MDTPESAGRRSNAPQIAVGLIVLALGGLLLADRHLAPDLRLMRSWWPLLLIVMGAVRVAAARAGADGVSRSLRSGVWLIMVGVWGLASDWHLLGLTYATSWPLLVIGAGVMMVWRSVDTRSGLPIGRERGR